jgi:FkbM family methyltransferase
MDNMQQTPQSSPPVAKRVMRAVWRVLPRSGLSFDVGKLVTRSCLRPATSPQRVTVRFAGRIPMTLDLASFVSNDLYCLDDHYESVTLRLWRRLAAQSSVVLDVGSHIGTFALVAADANPQARVVAVEADPRNFEMLEQHAAGYANITPVHAAIGESKGVMWFCAVPDNDGGGYLSAEPTDAPGSRRVETVALAELCRSQTVQQVDLMKLDVEGLEYALMVPASEFWECFAPRHLIVELTVDKKQAGRTGEILRAMQQRGYRAQRIQGLYALPWGKPCDLANWHFWKE